MPHRVISLPKTLRGSSCSQHRPTSPELMGSPAQAALPAALVPDSQLLLNQVRLCPALGPLHRTVPLPKHFPIRSLPAHSLPSFWSLPKCHFLGDIAPAASCLLSQQPCPVLPSVLPTCLRPGQCLLHVLSGSRGQGFRPLCSALHSPVPQTALACGGCPINTHRVNSTGTALGSLLRIWSPKKRCKGKFSPVPGQPWPPPFSLQGALSQLKWAGFALGVSPRARVNGRDPSALDARGGQHQSQINSQLNSGCHILVTVVG